MFCESHLMVLTKPFSDFPKIWAFMLLMTFSKKYIYLFSILMLILALIICPAFYLARLSYTIKNTPIV